MNRLSSFKDNYKYLKVKQDLNHLSIFLSKNNITIDIYYSYIKKDEIFFDQIYYSTSCNSNLLVLVEAYFTMIQNMSVERVAIMNMKEFDYFLRVENSIPSFEYYTPEMLEVLSLGEDLKKAIIPKEVDDTYILDTEKFGPFELLSYGDQLDFVEEFYSAFIFNDSRFNGISFDTEIEDFLISINTNVDLDLKLKNFIIEKINTELRLKGQWKIIFN